MLNKIFVSGENSIYDLTSFTFTISHHEEDTSI